MNDSVGTIASGGGLSVRPPQREATPSDPRAPEETAAATQSVAADGVTVAEPVPDRAEGLELLGEFARSGHRRPPCLVRRGDGQMIQLTPVAYAVLEATDGRRGYDEIASVVGERIGKVVTAKNIRFLTEAKLRPLGLLESSDGPAPALKKADPLLGLRLRMVVSDPSSTRRIAAPFTPFFYPPVVLAFSIAFMALIGWLLFSKGLGSPTRQLFYEPGLLLLVFALMMLSAAWHEIGHAAACRYGGADPGAMGAALYLVWPAFYTDVSDAYRLDRRGRLRVDLGGIYFNAIFAVAAFGLWVLTNWDALLLIVPLQLFQTVRQLIPLVRLDGYHILADLTGVPDLFAHIKPILTGLWPTRWGRSENKTLKPWVRFVVTAWVLIVVPVLLLMVATMVVIFPRLAATAWDSLGMQWESMRGHLGERHWTGAATSTLSLLAIAVPVLSVAYLFGRIARRVALRVWRGTTGRPVMRGISVVVAFGLLAGLATMWWPDADRYRPIEQGERWVVGDPKLGVLAPEGSRVAGFARALAVGLEERRSPMGMLTTTETPASSSRGRTLAGSGGISTSAGSKGTAPSGSDLFGLPSPPRANDNQALAVNYEDGTSVLDMALSLVFASAGDVADHKNEAYALASCTGCIAIAAAFQLVIIIGSNPAVVPENVAVAVNAFCVNCLTYALAFQIVVTLAGPLSDATAEELANIWKKLESIQANMKDISPEELYLVLKQIQEEIVALLVGEAASVSGGSLEASAAGTEATSELSSPGPSPAITPESSSSPSPTSSPSPSQEPSPNPEPSPDDEPASEPSPSTEPSPNETGD